MTLKEAVDKARVEVKLQCSRVMEKTEKFGSASPTRGTLAMLHCAISYCIMDCPHYRVWNDSDSCDRCSLFNGVLTSLGEIFETPAEKSPKPGAGA